jgi:EAL domain-containing protein (putative c-di-GMP-specific phosphodiesterase class I)
MARVYCDFAEAGSANRSSTESQPNPMRAVYVTVQVDNRAAITAAFGHAVTEQAMAALKARAVRIAGAPNRVAWGDKGRLDFLIPNPLRIDGLAPIDIEDEALVREAVTDALAGLPVAVDENVFMLGLTIALGTVDIGEDGIDEAAFTPLWASLNRYVRDAAPRPVSHPEALSRELYASDMAVAVAIAETIRTDRLFLAWQPVVGEDDSEILYHEGLLRIVGADGALVLPGRIIPALERAGLIRQLDRHVALKTLEWLRADPDLRLGCNISAQSAIDDGWWTPVFAELAADPALAKRLVIEITESAQFSNISLAIAFTDRLRALGCRIAFDDFGVGHSSIRNLAAFAPDIVKIDAFYLRCACRQPGDQGLQMLHHLIGLAGSMARDVIVEGIASETDLDVARTAGARWAQGYHLGSPPMSAPCRGQGLGAWASDRAAANRLIAVLHDAAPIQPVPDVSSLRRGAMLGAPLLAILSGGIFGLWKMLV